jgi:DNA-directed RNA polymerase subunit RPC12/RpoP
VALDWLCQPTGALWQLTPSVFVRCEANGRKSSAPQGAFFRCTVCGSIALVDGEVLSCTDCGARFAVRGGIYDLKTPLEEGTK